MEASSRLIDVDKWDSAEMCSSSSNTNSNSSAVRSCDLWGETKMTTERMQMKGMQIYRGNYMADNNGKKPATSLHCSAKRIPSSSSHPNAGELLICIQDAASQFAAKFTVQQALFEISDFKTTKRGKCTQRDVCQGQGARTEKPLYGATGVIN